MCQGIAIEIFSSFNFNNQIKVQHNKNRINKQISK